MQTNSPEKKIKISDYTYDLPEDKIARYPLDERSGSKLLVWQKGEIRESVFNKIPNILSDNSMLVFNNTRVVRARLQFRKSTGARIEIFCLEPHHPADYELSFGQTTRVEWRCIIGNAKKWKDGELQMTLKVKNQEVILGAEKVGQNGNDTIIRFLWNKGYTFGEILEQAGTIPIPPYLKRESEETDKTRYQTVFAKIKGSVAAPTAGLHFTDTLIQELHDKGISTEELTLHVGAGTFQPVKAETIDGHTMHSEKVSVSLSFLKNLLAHTGKVIAVGTTSVRSLESLYQVGLKIQQGEDPGNPAFISQWEAYDENPKLTGKQALEEIIGYLEKNNQDELQFSTQIIIVPGYKFWIIDGMFTNFHQPQSTLLLLISAFLGNDWRDVYNYALNNNFRFLSYGDSNLYLRE